MVKADTRATAHYLTQSDVHALVIIWPTNMDTWVILPENVTMDPEQVGHLPLALPPYTTETCAFQAFQNAYLKSVGRLCYDYCQAISNKKFLQVLESNKNLIPTRKPN